MAGGSGRGDETKAHARREAERAARKATALRANLQRRKAQARARLPQKETDSALKAPSDPATSEDHKGASK